jgi:hypothetical protein
LRQRDRQDEQRLLIPTAITQLPIPENPPTLPRPNNLLKIVVNPKTKDAENGTDSELIERTEQLLKDARSGKLKGLGFMADYGTGYIFGLEGSYLADPEAAIIPLKRLDRRIMDQVEKKD